MPSRRIFRALLLSGFALLAAAAPASAQRDWSAVQIRSTELAQGVHMLEGLGGNIGVSAGEDGVILIDDQLAPLSGKILAAVREINDGPIRFVINTHWHGDHVGGNEALAQGGAWIVAHDHVRTRMSTEQFSRLMNRATPPSPEGAWPVVTFSDNMTFHLNGQDIHAFHVENAHTDGDVIIHFENRNVIHMGDCFWNGQYPLIDVSAGGSIRGMIRAANAGLLLADGATKIVPGHGPLGNREDLRAFRDMLVEVEKRIQALVVAGQSLEQISQAMPLADLDVKWASEFMTPKRFLQAVVDDMSR